MTPRKADATLETQHISGVELLAVGTWQGHGCPDGGCRFTADDIDGIVEAWQATQDSVKAPVKLGHGKEQELLEAAGLPAAGWLTNLRRMGTKLVADLEQVPKKVADLIRAGAYRTRSAELRANFEVAGKKWPLMVTGLALLGAELPAVQGLDDIAALYQTAKLEFKPDVSAYYVLFNMGGPAWDDAYIHDLEDSAFAYIAPDGSKDADQRTIPRILRHFPHHDESDAVDVPHVYQALELVRQSGIGADGKVGAIDHLLAHARAGGMVDLGNQLADLKEVIVDEKKLRKLLGLADDADLEAAVKRLHDRAGAVATALSLEASDDPQAAIKALQDRAANAPATKPSTKEDGDGDSAESAELRGEIAKLSEQVVTLQGQNARQHAERLVEDAIQQRRLLPAQRVSALQLALTDEAQFKTFVDAQPPNLVDLSERGHAGDGKTFLTTDGGTVNLSDLEPTEEERKVAEQMSVWTPAYRIQLMKSKAATKGVELPADFGKEADADKD